MVDRISAVLFTMLLALGATLVWEWQWVARAPSPPMPDVRGAVKSTIAPVNIEFNLADLQRLTATRERPVFHASRRPAEQVVEAPPTANEPDQVPRPAFILNAIIIADGERIALMHNPVAGKLARLREGDDIERWLVEGILDDQVVLVNGNEIYEVFLRKLNNVPSTSRDSGGDDDAGDEQSVGAEDADIRRPRRPKRGPRKKYLQSE